MTTEGNKFNIGHLTDNFSPHIKMITRSVFKLVNIPSMAKYNNENEFGD